MRIQPVFFASPVYYERSQFLADAGVLLTEIQKMVVDKKELLCGLHLPEWLPQPYPFCSFPASEPDSEVLLRPWQ